jgi:hypothetical protein
MLRDSSRSSPLTYTLGSNVTRDRRPPASCTVVTVADLWIQAQGGGFRHREVDSGAGRWIQAQGGGFGHREVDSGTGRWIQVQSGGFRCVAAAIWVRWIQAQSGGFRRRAVDNSGVLL